VVVVSGAPADAWQIRLQESGDAYVVTLRSQEGHEAHVVVRLPRRLVDDAVFAATRITVELTPEARVAAYTESTARTLTAATLRTLVARVVTPESLSGEEASLALERLETELQYALETVRRARSSLEG
jgi:hypothetical protein